MSTNDQTDAAASAPGPSATQEEVKVEVTDSSSDSPSLDDSASAGMGFKAGDDSLPTLSVLVCTWNVGTCPLCAHLDSVFPPARWLAGRQPGWLADRPLCRQPHATA